MHQDCSETIDKAWGWMHTYWTGPTDQTPNTVNCQSSKDTGWMCYLKDKPCGANIW